MSYRKVILFFLLFALTLLLLNSTTSAEFRKRVLPEKPQAAVIPPGFDRNHIEVKFLDDLSVGLTAEGKPFDRQGAALKSSRAENVIDKIAETGVRWRRSTGDMEVKITEMVAVAEACHNREIANLNNYFILTVPDGVQAEDWLNELNALPEVEIAQPLPLPMKLPFWANYVPRQGYLNAAPDGIDARYAWNHGGGDGMMVSVCDFEYSWNLTHYDFDTAYTHYATIFPVGYTPSDPFSDERHGTAVLGELISMRGYLGTTGGVYNTNIKVAPTYLDDGGGGGPAWLLGVAMNHAMGMGGVWRGDVMLIEQQMAGPNWTGSGDTGLVPIEWYEPWYNIVLTATGNGIHVVECAGNGFQNLDDAVYNTGHAPFNPSNHSGAVIVGAGAAPAAYGGTDVDRSRLDFSNYGSRVDLQGWGEMVTTTGYGTFYNEHPDSNWDYTGSFSGTSSAGPIVASAVAAMESIYQWRDPIGIATPFGVDTVRNLLKNTGTPQQSGTYPASQNIGPRPNLKLALAAVLSDECEYYKKPYPDYAPAGVPDFDQLQKTNWSLPDGRWTHSGPAALANCFWWFDSKYETGLSGPPTISDNYPLVQAYLPGIDDHDPSNVEPFIDSLAWYCRTNAAMEGPGTTFEFLQMGAYNWLDKCGLEDSFDLRIVEFSVWDSITVIRDEILDGQNVILLLGFWQNVPGIGWTRIGGHYVTVAGVCETRGQICISDPLYDMLEGEPPVSPGVHADNVHNDAQYVSGPHTTMHHDNYDLAGGVYTGVPYVVQLKGYPIDYPEIINLMEVNPIWPFVPISHPYIGLEIETFVEWALIICPAGSGDCCVDLTGNVNCDELEVVDITDITRLIDYLYLSHAPLCCLEEADVNVSGGEPDISDITFLINHLYIDHIPLPGCP